MKNISICIPTFNRADTLKVVLGHLAGFASRDFEVIIGDNQSTDHTASVVREFEGVFSRLVYVKRPQNVGFARNMDAIVRRATRDYVYVLADDDLVYEAALVLMAGVLDGNPNVVAVTGPYNSTRKADTGYTVDYSDATATILKRNQHAGLFANLSYCDAHPFMRREVFARHCAYEDRTGALIPLYTKLLTLGDLVVVSKPIFQHVTTTVSLTSSMTEAWFIDMGMADIELARAMLPADPEGWNLWTAKGRLTQLFYFQAARMAWNRHNYPLLWLMLQRCKAVGVGSDELLAKCEFSFMHDFIAQRIGRTLSDLGCTRIVHEETPAVLSVLPALRQQCPALTFHPWDPREIDDGDTALLCENTARRAAEAPPLAPMLGLQDAFDALRLTPHPARLWVEGERLALRYTEQTGNDLLSQDTGAFQRLCAPYSSEA